MQKWYRVCVVAVVSSISFPTRMDSSFWDYNPARCLAPHALGLLQFKDPSLHGQAAKARTMLQYEVLDHQNDWWSPKSYTKCDQMITKSALRLWNFRLMGSIRNPSPPPFHKLVCHHCIWQCSWVYIFGVGKSGNKIYLTTNGCQASGPTLMKRKQCCNA